MSSAELEIERATLSDVPAIREISGHWRVGDRSEADLMDRGFLVSDFSVDDYRHLVAASDYCFVARRDGQMVGYLLAYSRAALASIDDTTAEWVGTRLDDFIVIKQVAVAPQHTGAGIGRDLYLHIINLVRRQGQRLVAAVVDSPQNVRSRAFHRGMGFTEAFSLRHADRRMRSIWVYSTAPPSDEVLSTQYKAAVSLYVHEDTLNWDKLRNYLYITAGTAAAVGFVLGQRPQPAGGFHPILVGMALCLVGLVTSVGFAVALHSGVSYLAIRKEAVAELEDSYISRNGVRVVSRLARAKPWLHRSPTTWVLRLTPIVGVGLWLAALAYLVVLV